MSFLLNVTIAHVTLYDNFVFFFFFFLLKDEEDIVPWQLKSRCPFSVLVVSLLWGVYSKKKEKRKPFLKCCFVSPWSTAKLHFTWFETRVLQRSVPARICLKQVDKQISNLGYLNSLQTPISPYPLVFADKIFLQLTDFHRRLPLSPCLLGFIPKHYIIKWCYDHLSQNAKHRKLNRAPSKFN